MRVTEVVGDAVAGDTGDGAVGVLDDLAVLDVDTIDLSEVPAGGTVVGNDCRKQ